MLSGCPVWVTLGALIISASFAFILFALWKIHHLIKSEALQWNKFEHRTVKQIYTDAMAMPGLMTKFLSFFVSVHERRFLGEWSIERNANLWGFLLAETGALYYCFALRMGKMILVAIVLNLEMPSMPLVPPFILLFLYFFGAIEGFMLWSNRDSWTNKGEALMAVGNFLVVLIMVLQVAVEEDRLPPGLAGPVGIWLTCATTSMSMIVALAEPVLNIFQGPLGTTLGAIQKGLSKLGLGHMARPVVHFLEEVVFVTIMLFNGVIGREMHRVAEHKLNEELATHKLFLFATVLRCAEKWKLRTFGHRLHPAAHSPSVRQEEDLIQSLILAENSVNCHRFVLKVHFKLDIRQLGLLSWKMKV